LIQSGLLCGALRHRFKVLKDFFRPQDRFLDVIADILSPDQLCEL
jgi:hypothetical protein